LASEEGKLDQNITITPAMANDIGQLSADSALMGIKQGETYTLRDLLYGLFLVSGNDAAIVIADALAGNLQNFVAKMNQQASQIGLNDTHYVNPHGLLATGQFSSAHDLAILGKTVLSIPMIQQISGTRQYHIAQSASHAEHFLTNGDQFLWWYPGVNAGKTGWDAATDFIQVVSCIRNGHHLIGVVMHTNDWWTDMRDLMNWGFSNFTWVSPRDADAVSPIPFDVDWNYFAKDKKDNTIPLGSQGRYYIFTGYSISGSILTYFDQHGALGNFGYPIAEPAASGTASTTQRFEHGSIQCSLTSKQCKTV
jgi:D-alanyl-D-alanine carboxypeptidase